MKKILKIAVLSLAFLNAKNFAMSDEQKNTIKKKLTGMTLYQVNYHPEFEANLNTIFPEYMQIKRSLSLDNFYTGIGYVKNNLIQSYQAHENNEAMQQKIMGQILLLELDIQQNRLRSVGTTNVSAINNAAINEISRYL